MKPVEIIFEGIDSFNRPIFISFKDMRYGSTNILFNYSATKKEVLEKISEKDLIWFGNEFDCEPNGETAPPLIIVDSFSKE